MKVKDIKRRINSGKRATYVSNKKLKDTFKRKVINPLIREVKKLNTLDPNEIKVIADNLIQASEVHFPFTEELFRLEVKTTKNIGKSFLEQVNALKQGRKVKNARSFIIASKKQLTDYNHTKALSEFNKAVNESLALIRSDIQAHSLSIQDSLQKRALSAIDDVDFSILDSTRLSQAKKKAKIARSLKASLNRKVKKYVNSLTDNKALEAYSKGDVKAAGVLQKLTGKKMVKKWVTRFDSKVRNWHDTVNFQTRRLTDLFDVKNDRLVAPKIPPISPENYFNCRCVVAYKVIGK